MALDTVVLAAQQPEVLQPWRELILFETEFTPWLYDLWLLGCLQYGI